MKKEEIKLSFNRATYKELSSVEKKLINQSKSVLKNAYAPYSGFLVGASLLLDNGKIVKANNQENVAFPSGLCAERVALFYAGSEYPDAIIKSIAITARFKSFQVNDIVSPCGACRQVMAEYQERQKNNIRILLHSSNDEVLIFTKVDDLLPFIFRSSLLKKH